MDRRRTRPRSTCTPTPRCRSEGPRLAVRGAGRRPPATTSRSRATASRPCRRSPRTTASGRWPRWCSPSTPRPPPAPRRSPTRRSPRRRAANPDVLIPFASIDPYQGPAGVQQARRLVARVRRPRLQVPPQRPGLLPRTTGWRTRCTRRSRSRAPIAVFHTGQTGIGAGVRGGGGIRLKYSNPMLVDDVAADFPRPADHPGAPVVPLAGRGAGGGHPQAAGLHRPVRLVAEVLPAAAGPVRQHAAAGQGAVRLRLPAADPGPLAGRLRRSCRSRTRSARRSSRRTPPGCSACSRPSPRPSRERSRCATKALGSWPARRARKTPHRTALVHEDRATTYARARTTASTALAHALRAARDRPRRPGRLPRPEPSGLPGDAVRRRHCSARCSSRSTPGSPRPELAYQLDDSGSTPAGLRRAARGPLASPDADRRSCARRGRRVRGGAGRGGAGADRRAGQPRRPLPDHVHLGHHRPAQGRHAHPRQHHLELRQRPGRRRLCADEVTLVSAPLFHTAGAQHDLPAHAAQGRHGGSGSSLRPGAHPGPDRPAPGHLHVRRAGHVRACSPPSRAGQQADLSQLRILMCGGAPVPAPLDPALPGPRAAFVQGYGMTEAAPGVAAAGRRARREQGRLGRRPALLHRRAAGRRPTARRPTPASPARCWCSGPNVMPGYWGRPRGDGGGVRTTGWFRTGDVATADADGYVTHRRPDQGHDHLRRGERLPGRGRGRPARPPRRRRVRGVRRARRDAGARSAAPSSCSARRPRDPRRPRC